MSNLMNDEAAGRVAPAEQEARAEVFPAVTVRENDQGHLLEAELPGVEERGLRVTVEQRTLTIEGENAVAAPAGHTLVMREIVPAKYRAVIDLPERIDTAGIKAGFKHGVLRIQLPHREEAKPRRIEVAAA